MYDINNLQGIALVLSKKCMSQVSTRGVPGQGREEPGGLGEPAAAHTGAGGGHQVELAVFVFYCVGTRHPISNDSNQGVGRARNVLQRAAPLARDGSPHIRLVIIRQYQITRVSCQISDVI